MLTITRDALREAVEAGIRRSPLSTPDANALRTVAATTAWVTRGDWECDGVGCPAAQAGLHTNNGNATGALTFAVRFDSRVGALLNITGTHVIEVVD